MSDSFKNKRVRFKVGKQKKFFQELLVKNNLSLLDLSKTAGVSRRSALDWVNGKNLVSKEVLDKILLAYKVPRPKYVQFIDKYWYTRKGGKAGYKSVIQKYGRLQVDEDMRLSAWKKWYKREGRFKEWKNAIPKTFNKPKKSAELAEFIGIMIGDGTMSKYALSVCLHFRDDEEYGKYVADQMLSLFRVKPSISRFRNVNYYSIFRVGLVDYLSKMGLVIGNKIDQQLDVPKWIKENKKFSKVCLRGIFDTDGCLVRHKYVSNRKVYRYKKIDITSRSKNLLNTMHKILLDLKIKNRIGKNCVRVESEAGVKSFFEKIGSHNPKHLKKYFGPEI